MDTAPGKVTYTQMLNPRGGIECDLTVTRLAVDRFALVTGTAFGTHDLSWIRSRLGSREDVSITDVTSGRCCIGVWGPLSRALMQSVSDDDFSEAGFPYLTARDAVVGGVPVRAVRVTYVGELGRDSPWGRRPRATEPSTRCAWKKATAIGARTSTRNIIRTKPGWVSALN
jgi:4-methylaminobutanoate oxidase (formaldehyde-forming)